VTLVAVSVQSDGIEIVTDTLAYSVVEFHHCSKLDVFPHIDAVVTGRGVTALVVTTTDVVHAARRLTGGRPPRAEWPRRVL
jgi:hypothetical protein